MANASNSNNARAVSDLCVTRQSNTFIATFTRGTDKEGKTTSTIVQCRYTRRKYDTKKSKWVDMKPTGWKKYTVPDIVDADDDGEDDIGESGWKIGKDVELAKWWPNYVVDSKGNPTNTQYPYLTGFEVRAWSKKGDKKKTNVSFDIQKPGPIELTLSADGTNFIWRLQENTADPTNGSSHRWAYRSVYQTVVSQETDKNKVEWDSHSTEESINGPGGWVSTDVNHGFTKWIRVKVQGPAGETDWAYGARIKADPPDLQNPTPTGANIKLLPLDDPLHSPKVERNQVTVYYSYTNLIAGSLEKIIIQYKIGTPISYAEDFSSSCPDPDNGWSDGKVIKWPGGSDASYAEAKFYIPNEIDYMVDSVLYVRITAENDGVTNSSLPVAVKGGRLAKPTISSISVDVRSKEEAPETGRTVTAVLTGNTVVPGSKVCLLANGNAMENSIHDVVTPDHSSSDEITIGPIPFDSFGDIIVKDKNTICFGARTFLGDVANPVMWSYDVNLDYSHDISVPVPPLIKGIKYLPADESNNNQNIVQIDFDWTWTSATKALISWSDFPQGWQSNSEPTKCEIVSRRYTTWFLTGLELGKSWYIRMQHVKEAKNDQDKEYSSPWGMPGNNYNPSTDPPAAKYGVQDIDIFSADGQRMVFTLEYPAAYIESVSIKPTGAADSSYVDTTYYSWTGAGSSSINIYSNEALDIPVNSGNSIRVIYRHEVPYPLILKFNSSKPGCWVNDMTSGIVRGRPITLSWSYTPTDTTGLASTVIYQDENELTTVQGNVQSYTFTPDYYDSNTYEEYTSHNYQVVTISESGIASPMSDPCVVYFVEEPTADIKFSDITGEPDSGFEVRSEGGEEVLYLTHLPAYIEANVSAVDGDTQITIARLGDVNFTRPDDRTNDGFDGESIFAVDVQGNEVIPIELDSLVGRLDNHKSYTMTINCTDKYGQSVVKQYMFFVEWNIHAVMPVVSLERDPLHMACIINVEPGEGSDPQGFMEIYRLSSDKPELIHSGVYGSFVDRYPASNGGYRVVACTRYGDWITEDVTKAWYDVYTGFIFTDIIVNYGDNMLILPFNVEIQNSWMKDFERKSYLNGQVRGSWNEAVTKDISINTTVRNDDDVTFRKLREIAEYPGICHIRTGDGTSYGCDLQVSYADNYNTVITEVSLTAQKVDEERTTLETVTAYVDTLTDNITFEGE